MQYIYPVIITDQTEWQMPSDLVGIYSDLDQAKQAVTSLIQERFNNHQFLQEIYKQETRVKNDTGYSDVFDSIIVIKQPINQLTDYDQGLTKTDGFDIAQIIHDLI